MGGTSAAVAVAAAVDVPVGMAVAVAKGLTNAAAVFDHFRVPTAIAAAFHHSPRNRQNHYVGRRSPPPRPCRKPPTASAWGLRRAAGEGTFDCITSFTLRLAYALRTRCSSRVFSWVCVDDRFLYDVFVRKLSDDYVDNLLLRFCDPHSTHHVHELIDACQKCFRVFVGVHCNVLQLLKEGFLRLRHRQRPFRDDPPGLKNRVTSGSPPVPTAPVGCTNGSRAHTISCLDVGACLKVNTRALGVAPCTRRLTQFLYY